MRMSKVGQHLDADNYCWNESRTLPLISGRQSSSIIRMPCTHNPLPPGSDSHQTPLHRKASKPLVGEGHQVHYGIGEENLWLSVVLVTYGLPF